MIIVVIHARTHSTVLFHAACTHELSIVRMYMRYSSYTITVYQSGGTKHSYN